METPGIARPKGYYFEVRKGQGYFWCACGRSANQPFCDGSHAGTGFLPVLYEAKADEDVIFCGCKHTATRPFCDGTHNDLPGGMALDDPDSATNRTVGVVSRGREAQAPLDGACYVFSTARAKLMRRGSMAYCPVIAPSLGAVFQSQFYTEFDDGVSPVIGANGSPAVLFATAGQGEMEISGRRFAFGASAGFYVRPGEVFRVRNSGPGKVRLFISNRPGTDELSFPDEMPVDFDEAWPNRVAEIDPARRQAMGERYFQILVSREHGSTGMTQFIGHVPHSKAAPHRHLYEEAVIFLNGEGAVWTETKKTAVGPGDVLFLPRKQVHSVECTVAGGLDVVGVICPGDNPSISY